MFIFPKYLFRNNNITKICNISYNNLLILHNKLLQRKRDCRTDTDLVLPYNSPLYVLFVNGQLTSADGNFYEGAHYRRAVFGAYLLGTL